ncbi:rhamnogalacturonan lyase [Cellulomonas chitinilytica]|uniref:Rhamnogalacturonan lyase n=1 Tax=Cellulomonas chitinilytica TaxID=398759 RepID=A0A919P8B6_9CELL|nr:cellulose binding domain-containing protein [Cellulomonas chitinilytica]GIG23431.1 rhamnogalacturonan lyase [Cellulomonas chitinilytica]
MSRGRGLVATVLAAGLGVTGAGLVGAATASAAVACRVTYTVTNQWSTGFGADVKIENVGDAVSGWRLTWSFGAGQTITQAWNGTATQSGSNVTVTDAGYNGAIPSGGSAGFGFNGTWNGSSNPVPTSFALNGTTCTGTVPTTNPTTTPTTTPTVEPTPTASPTTPPPPSGTAWQAENLDRGLISVRSGSGNLVQWRLLGTEPASTGFNVYRSGTKLNSSPITSSTNYLDSGAAADASYTVRAVVNGTEQAASAAALKFSNGYLDVPIQKPGSAYEANDASVGDLDGDGDLDIVLKWNPTNAKDNSQSGVTDNVFVDGYRLDGTRLWRIDLGRNIRAGAHYTQFQVYDYDGDGTAEVAMKTADGTTSGTGQVIGSASADYRNSSGYVLSGPEYFTVFNGRTGAILATTDFVPPRGTVSSWGDSYGNRVDRFLAGTAYLDGQRPSIIEARGYYTRTVITAWDWRDGKLTRRWTFDSNDSGNSTYAGQGNHALITADVDGDGRQEIVYGAMAIDDNGKPLWNTRTGHGDAAHLGDLIPGRPGLEYFKVTEDASQPDSWMADARTGQILWKTSATTDNGRGVSGDIWSGSAGAESWSSSDSSLRDTTGAAIGRKPGSTNFLAWWDADTTRELLDGTHVDKYGTSGDTRLLTASGVHSNNGTKSTPSLSGDLLGDWREEVVWPTSDDSALRIYATPTVTTTRLWTLLHDQQYRTAIAWQNTAYNQPPHPGFFLGTPFTMPAQPNVYTR